MTSCVFSFFFFVVLVSSNTAADHAGLKLRVTNHAQAVWKDFSMMFLKQLVDKPIPDLPCAKGVCNITGMKITELNVTPDQAEIHFIDNTGVRFVIQRVDITFSFNTMANMHLLTAASTIRLQLAVDFTVKLERTAAGGLSLLMPNCHIILHESQRESDNMLLRIAGTVLDFLVRRVSYVSNTVSSYICTFIGWGLPPPRNMHAIPIPIPIKFPWLINGFNFSADLSLTRDVQVTATYIELSLKGIILGEGKNVDISSIQNRVEPVFNENDMMAYVGISEFAFNSAGMSLYKAGPFQVNYTQVPRNATKVVNIVKGVSRIKQLFRQPSNLFTPLIGEVGFTEPPKISINAANGVTVNLRVKFKSLAKPTDKKTKDVISVSVACQAQGKVTVEGLTLTLPSNINCEIITKNGVRAILVEPLRKFLLRNARDFLNAGLPIPLPAGVDFVQGKIDYHDGFVVIGGSLTLSDGGRTIATSIINS